MNVRARASVCACVLLSVGWRLESCVVGVSRQVHHINDGTVAIGNRGPGRREACSVCAGNLAGTGSALAAPAPWDSGPDVVFIGSLQGQDTSRVAPLRALQRARLGLVVYGPEQQWADAGIQTAGEVWAHDAAELERSAKVVLRCATRPETALDRAGC